MGMVLIEGRQERKTKNEERNGGGKIREKKINKRKIKWKRKGKEVETKENGNKKNMKN